MFLIENVLLLFALEQWLNPYVHFLFSFHIICLFCTSVTVFSSHMRQMCYQYVSTSPPKMSWFVKDRWVWGTGTHRWGHQLVNNVGALSTWLSRESNLLSWDIDFTISLQKEGIVAPLEVTVWFRAILGELQVWCSGQTFTPALVEGRGRRRQEDWGGSTPHPAEPPARKRGF